MKINKDSKRFIFTQKIQLHPKKEDELQKQNFVEKIISKMEFL